MELRGTLAGYPRAGASGGHGWVSVAVDGEQGSVPLRVFLSEPPPVGIGPGSVVTVQGAAQRAEPGDSAAFVLRGSVQTDALAASPVWVSGTVGVAAHLRDELRVRSDRLPGAELVPGFAVGDTSLVPETLVHDMLQSSLTHLTAVSGANCALVTGAVILVLRRLGCGARLRAIAAAAALLGFLVLVGPDPSVQRAAVMAGVLLLSGFGGKRGVALPALGLAMFVLLVADPWQARSAGFALSVTATAGILWWARPLSEFLERRLRLPRLVALPTAVALAAQLACGPILLLLQPDLPVAGVLANVLAAPAAPWGTALGLAAALAGPVTAAGADALVWAASLPARWVAAVAEVTADLPGSRWNWPGGWLGAILLLVVQAALGIAVAIHSGRFGAFGAPAYRPRRPWEDSRPRPRQHRRAIAALAGSACGLLVAVIVAVPLAERAALPSDWSVVACDVGQGDALLVRDPAYPSQVMLVDTGDDPDLLAQCLTRFGVDRIALLVLSHDDRDHVGALESLLGRVDAALVSPPVPGDSSPSEAYPSREVTTRLAAAGVPVTIGVSGLVSTSGASPTWRVIGPSETAIPGDTNAASLVLLVAAGDTTVLLLGDTGADEQQRLLAQGHELSADIVKIAHHGSRDQSDALPARIGAAIGLVSVGADNGYGHPTSETIRAYEAVGTAVHRTDEHGTLAVFSEGGALRVWAERAARAAPES